MRKKPEPVIVTDPRELAFLRIVRDLPPEALEDLTEATRMLVHHQPEHELRAAWLKFFRSGGYVDPEERAAKMVRLWSPRTRSH